MCYSESGALYHKLEAASFVFFFFAAEQSAPRNASSTFLCHNSLFYIQRVRETLPANLEAVTSDLHAVHKQNKASETTSNEENQSTIHERGKRKNKKLASRKLILAG